MELKYAPLAAAVWAVVHMGLCLTGTAAALSDDGALAYLSLGLILAWCFLGYAVFVRSPDSEGG